MVGFGKASKEEMAYLLIALLLPLRNQIGVSVIVLQQPLV